MVIALRSILKLKEALGGTDLALEFPEGTTVSGLIDYMRDRWGERLSPHLFDPENGLPLPYVRIMVNGQTIQFLDGLGTVLKEGDEVLLLPLVGGG
ncbi:MAG: MoaD/ThiS family protein [Syntrophorhabdales bacterium]